MKQKHHEIDLQKHAPENKDNYLGQMSLELEREKFTERLAKADVLRHAQDTGQDPNNFLYKKKTFDLTTGSEAMKQEHDFLRHTGRWMNAQEIKAPEKHLAPHKDKTFDAFKTRLGEIEADYKNNVMRPTTQAATASQQFMEKMQQLQRTGTLPPSVQDGRQSVQLATKPPGWQGYQAQNESSALYQYTQINDRVAKKEYQDALYAKQQAERDRVLRNSEIYYNLDSPDAAYVKGIEESMQNNLEAIGITIPTPAQHENPNDPRRHEKALQQRGLLKKHQPVFYGIGKNVVGWTLGKFGGKRIPGSTWGNEKAIQEAVKQQQKKGKKKRKPKWGHPSGGGW